MQKALSGLRPKNLKKTYYKIKPMKYIYINDILTYIKAILVCYTFLKFTEF